MKARDEILSNLRLAQSYINDVLHEIDTQVITGFDKQDIEISKKIYQYAMDAKNTIVYGGSLPF